MKTEAAAAKSKKQNVAEEEDKNPTPCLRGVGPGVMRWGGPGGAGVGGLAGDEVFPHEGIWVWWGENVLVKDVEKGGVVDLVVNAKMHDELVVRGEGLECERAEPCEGVGSL